jgi:MFS family permease
VRFPGDQFFAWGWRVPFWISIVMVAIGLWIRLGILETPVFQRILDQQEVARAPIIEVLRRHPKEIVLTALARMGQQAPFYIFVAFVFTYGTTVLHIQHCSPRYGPRTWPRGMVRRKVP